MPFPQVNAVLFDMDGLLLDSETTYTKVTNQVLAPYGKEMTWELKAQLMGRPGPDAAQHLIAATGIPLTPDEFMDQMDVKLQEAFRKVEMMPGAEKIVLHLAKHKVPMAIATGSKQKNYLIKSAHLPQLFTPFGDKVLCGDDPVLKGKGKPDPTIFLEAAKMLGITSEEDRAKVLVFEDGAPGVRAARSAGMEVIWVPDAELVKTMGADHDLVPSHTHSSLEHFQPEAWGLPPYSS